MTAQEAVDQGDGGPLRRQACEQDEGDEPEEAAPWPREEAIGESQQGDRQQGDDADIAHNAESGVEAVQAKPWWRAKIQHFFQCEPAFGNQVIAGILCSSLDVVRGGMGSLRRCSQDAGRDGQLVMGRKSGQLFDGRSIEIAGGEIHAGKVTASA
ncbi:hypothetical protein D3C78_670960 [compost metagenome]